jgi:hypothetical protein
MAPIKTKISNFTKFRPFGADLCHGERQADRRTKGQTYGWKDGQTDMAKLIITFCKFANKPKH